MNQKFGPRFIESSRLGDLQSAHPELITEDKIDLAIDELFDIDFPSKKDTKTAEEVSNYGRQLTGDQADDWGQWVYYPWLNKLVHFPPKDKLRALRTSRNRNLINFEEQAKLYQATIFIAGMSVGSNIVEALVAHGIGQTLILADMDMIEPSNLNRIRSPYHHIGLHKVEAIARKVWEIDPFIEIIPLLDGLTEANLAQVLNAHKVDVLVDEIDELKMKIILREQAKSHKLPIVMAADDGDDALIDIERYDLNPSQSMFAGRIPAEILDRIKQGDIPRAQLGMMIGKYFVGADNIPLRMYQSLGEVGKTLPSWPQLGGAAALSGIALAYAIRKILLSQKVQDGRVLISIDEKLGLEHLDETHQAELNKFKQMMES